MPAPNNERRTYARKIKVRSLIEPHPTTYSGFPFVSLVTFNGKSIISVVDNMLPDKLRIYSLDLCGPNKVDEELLIAIVAFWYDNNRTKWPISIEFSRRGITKMTQALLLDLDKESVTRIIGPVFQFPMAPDTEQKIKRRKRKDPPVGSVNDYVGHFVNNITT